MGYSKIKSHSMLITAGVIFSIAGVLSLLTSPALAFDDEKCRAWATEIKGRVEDVYDDTGNGFTLNNPGPLSNCSNLCEIDQNGDFINGDFRNSNRLRDPGGVISARKTKILESGTENGTGDMIFGTGNWGMVAFFCDATTITTIGSDPSRPDDITSSDDFMEVVVAAEHPIPTGCNTGYQEICRADITPPPQ